MTNVTRADLPRRLCVLIAAAIAGVLIARVMFDEVLWQVSAHARSGSSQWFSEVMATFGLVIAIAGAVRHRPAAAGFWRWLGR